MSNDRPGILPDRAIRELIGVGGIRLGAPAAENQI